MRWGVILAAALLAAPAGAQPKGPEFVTADVARFYAVYDAAGGKPSAEQLDRDYLAHGTPGLAHFARLRRVTGTRIAETLAARPQVYVGARECLAVLPGVKRRLSASFATLVKLYPQAKLPPVTLVIGRGRPVGITDGEGVTMGVEALCAADFMHPDLTDRFVHSIAHEYGHIQQPPAVQAQEPGDGKTTLLQMALIEGAAELTAELISGDVGNHQHRAWTKGKEAEIEARFLRDKDKTELGDWFGNAPGTAEKPGDLGYWVGYRIVKAYYAGAKDKPRALAEIYALKDPEAILAASGWRPGR